MTDRRLELAEAWGIAGLVRPAEGRSRRKFLASERALVGVDKLVAGDAGSGIIRNRSPHSQSACCWPARDAHGDGRSAASFVAGWRALRAQAGLNAKPPIYRLLSPGGG